MGYRRLSGTEGCTSALFAVPTGIRLLVAEYLGPHQEVITANFVADTTESTLDRARSAFLSDAGTRGFAAPVVDGAMFYAAPARTPKTQRDFFGWTVSGRAVIAIQRLAKLPVDRQARSLVGVLSTT
jgi:hypothetical protein